MEESFEREISRCEKNGDPVSLIMIDIDNFKVFNDRFGHVAGDRALSAVASILRRQFRPRDLLVRFGGDEFAILLPEVNEAGAMAIADRVRMAVSGDTGDSDDSLIQIPIKISMGVAEHERAWQDLPVPVARSGRSPVSRQACGTQRRLQLNPDQQVVDKARAAEVAGGQDDEPPALRLGIAQILGIANRNILGFETRPGQIFSRRLLERPEVPVPLQELRFYSAETLV